MLPHPWGKALLCEKPVFFATCCKRAHLWGRPETGHRDVAVHDTPPDTPQAPYSRFSRPVGNFPTCGDTVFYGSPGPFLLWGEPQTARNCAAGYAQIWAKVLSRYGNRFFQPTQKWAADYPKLDCHRKFVPWQYNIFTQGAVGALCQPPDAMRKGAGAYGYILRSIPVCNYALRCDYSCHSFYTQKVAPSSW